MKKKNSRVIKLALIAAVFSLYGMTAVFAEEQTAGATVDKAESQQIIIKQTGDAETKTESITTVQPTTPKTTEQLTTQQPTTQSSTSTAWSKNKSGQFVNGNGKVIQGATMKGVDVSKWNGKIDWAKVAKTDVGYAIIRVGYGDNLTSQDDEYWNINALGCEKNNIPYGVYIYSYAENIKQAKSEAEHVLRLIKGHTLNFPIYYDMEDKVQAKLSKTTLNSIATTFLDTIKTAGYECGIYANLNWWNNYLPNSLAQNSSWYKWVAQYNNNACTYTGVYQMWQCTSDGSVDGINGRVDLNFWFGAVRNRLYNIYSVNKVATSKTVKAPKKVTLKSVKKGKKKATIKWKKITGVKGYQIQYSTSKKFKKKYTKSKLTKKTNIVIKKLKSKKTYYFRVKAYKINSSKKKVYSKKWSKVKSTKIK